MTRITLTMRTSAHHSSAHRSHRVQPHAERCSAQSSLASARGYERVATGMPWRTRPIRAPFEAAQRAGRARCAPAQERAEASHSRMGRRQAPPSDRVAGVSNVVRAAHWTLCGRSEESATTCGARGALHDSG